ncbi:MAG: chemotaxis protein CheC [Clostridiales Family XIII bacterium]|nr:chemotaxis protein CheC [Clostridiales Family XIII bacterium]
MINSYGELSDTHIDVLREIGNIGAGNAATSLSVLLDESVNISIPRVVIEDYNGVVQTIGATEELAIAILINFSGDVRGMVLFLLAFDDAKEIAQMLVGVEEGDDIGLSEMKISAIKEIGNILGSAYLGSIGTLTGLTFDISVPYAAIDMVGALMSAPMVEFSVDNTKILFIEESFSMETKSLRSHVILFADIPSLNKIMEKLGL